MRYFKTEDGGYVGLTGQCPREALGFVFLGRGPIRGFGVESVCDRPYTDKDLAKMSMVNAGDVPEDWFKAIGLEERPVEPAKLKMPRRRLQPVEIATIVGMIVSVTLTMLHLWKK
jgi:hypothetical protein